jgi:primosomal protein N'
MFDGPDVFQRVNLNAECPECGEFTQLKCSNCNSKIFKGLKEYNTKYSGLKCIGCGDSIDSSCKCQKCGIKLYEEIYKGKQISKDEIPKLIFFILLAVLFYYY